MLTALPVGRGFLYVRTRPGRSPCTKKKQIKNDALATHNLSTAIITQACMLIMPPGDAAVVLVWQCGIGITRRQNDETPPFEAASLRAPLAARPSTCPNLCLALVPRTRLSVVAGPSFRSNQEQTRPRQNRWVQTGRESERGVPEVSLCCASCPKFSCRVSRGVEIQRHHRPTAAKTPRLCLW